MAEPKDTEPQAETDEILAAGEQAGSVSDYKKPDGGKRPRRWPWLILPALILTGLAGWFALPQETRQSWLHDIGIPDGHPPVSGDVVVETPASGSGQLQTEPQQAVSEELSVPDTSTPPEPATQPEPEASAAPDESRSVPEMGSAAIDSAKVERLINVIGELRTGIDELKASNAELKDSLEARRVLDLKSRLRWLTNPDMSLAQIKLAWEDISLLPALSDSDREIARRTLAISVQNLSRVGLWLSTIDGFLDQYPSITYEETELIADDSWWAWLKNLFHLHRAPGMSTQRQNDLHNRLLQAYGKLSRQQWPAQKEWSALLAAIRKQEGEDADIGLPDDFSTIQHDIASMRAIAATWLGRL